MLHVDEQCPRLGAGEVDSSAFRPRRSERCEQHYRIGPAVAIEIRSCDPDVSWIVIFDDVQVAGIVRSEVVRLLKTERS
jgi:hypothetical protein